MGNLVLRQYVIQVGLSIFKKEECNVANKSALGITQPLTQRLDSNIESKSSNNTYLNIIELLFLI